MSDAKKCTCEMRMVADGYYPNSMVGYTRKPYSPTCPEHGPEVRRDAAAPRMLDLLRGAGEWYCGELPDGTDRREAIAALLAELDG